MTPPFPASSSSGVGNISGLKAKKLGPTRPPNRIKNPNSYFVSITSRTGTEGAVKRNSLSNT